MPKRDSVPPRPAWEPPEELRRKLPIFTQALKRRFFNEPDLEGVIQEALLRFWQSSQRRLIQSPAIYFYSIARRLLVKSALRRGTSPVDFNSDLVEEASSHLFNKQSYTEDPVEELERQLAYEELIAPAPDGYRHVLRMHFIEELSDEEIAKERNISPKSVGKYIERGLTFCRQAPRAPE